MAVRDAASLRDIMREFAAAVRAEPAARRLGIRVDLHDIEVWLLTAPIDRATEDRLYDASLLLDERIPDAHVQFHLLNPRYYVHGNAAAALPPDLEEIPLR